MEPVSRLRPSGSRLWPGEPRLVAFPVAFPSGTCGGALTRGGLPVQAGLSAGLSAGRGGWEPGRAPVPLRLCDGSGTICQDGGEAARPGSERHPSTVAPAGTGPELACLRDRATPEPRHHPAVFPGSSGHVPWPP